MRRPLLRFAAVLFIVCSLGGAWTSQSGAADAETTEIFKIDPAAESVSDPSATISATQPESTPASKKKSDELTFITHYETFLNRERPPAGIPDYTQIGAHFRTESEGRVFKGTLELGGSFATTVENYSNVYAPEAFVDLQTRDFPIAELKQLSRSRLSIGRRLETWSRLDRNWDLGLWEPLNRFDALRPIDQGLTGVFLEAGAGAFKFILFLSPIYIPEQAASFSIQNGKFRTSSPWFVEPTDRLIIFSPTATDISFDVRTPSTGSVISHSSAGMLLRWGTFEEGLFGQLSYAVKPRNQLATPFKGRIFLTDTNYFASVEIEPQVIYHQLSGLEIGYSKKRNDRKEISLGLSALADMPINENPGPNLTYQDLDSLLMLSPSISVALGMGASTEAEFGLSYLASYGGGAQMKGPFATNRGSIFGSRVPFKEAVAIDGRVWVGRGRRTTYSVGTRWLEELAENGSLLSADAAIDFSMNGITQDWRVSLMADMLGSQLPATENQGYVSRYRGNDRWMSQFRFVF